MWLTLRGSLAMCTVRSQKQSMLFGGSTNATKQVVKSGKLSVISSIQPDYHQPSNYL